MYKFENIGRKLIIVFRTRKPRLAGVEWKNGQCMRIFIQFTFSFFLLFNFVFNEICTEYIVVRFCAAFCAASHSRRGLAHNNAAVMIRCEEV